MDKEIVSTFMSSQPELYAIGLLIAYLGRKYWPLFKEKVEMGRSQLEGAARQEKHLSDISDKLTIMITKLDGFATKDDVIDLLLHKPSKKVLNGSGSIIKQGIE